MALDWEQGALAAGLACYRRQEFFETHEHWESVWVLAAEPERTFLQALIHVAVAFHHQQRGNALGAMRQLRRAMRKLETYPAEFGNVNVGAVRESITAWLKVLADSDASQAIPYPPIG